MARRGWLAVVLEFYVAPDPEGRAVVQAAREAFRPLLHLLERHPHATATVALDPGLSRTLLRHGEGGVLQGLASAVERGQVELAGGALGHALLPRLPRAEVERQIRLGHEALREAMGRSWRPQGFFPPALAWSRSVAEVAADRGARWVLADELALGRVGIAPTDRVAALRGRRDVLLFFRDRRASRALARGEPPPPVDGYRVAVLPATAFLRGSEALAGLQRLFAGEGPLLATPSSLASAFSSREEVEPLPCSWRTTEEELAAGMPFVPWSAPDNEIQALLWRLVALCLGEVERLRADSSADPAWTRMRTLLDEAIHTAPFRFASGRYFWDPDSVRAAARRLVGVLEASATLVEPAVLAEASAAEELVRSRLEGWERERVIDRLRHGTGGSTAGDTPELGG